jgi:16S rRNA (guanine527-N7)-methyltransferase
VSSDARAAQDHITARFDELGIGATVVEIQDLSNYFCLLAKWNDRMNLTALPVGIAGRAAIDRLLVEPLVASRLVLPTDALGVDLGSGGGSPAFPLKIGARHLRMILVESKERKCAFLREAARALELEDIEVANARFEMLTSRAALVGAVDLTSFRAVRTDASLWSAVRMLLKSGGRVFWFGGPESSDDPSLPESQFGLRLVSAHVLVPTDDEGGSSRLAVLQKT